jgi:hypothetical protein
VYATKENEKQIKKKIFKLYATVSLFCFKIFQLIEGVLK